MLNTRKMLMDATGTSKHVTRRSQSKATTKAVIVRKAPPRRRRENLAISTNTSINTNTNTNIFTLHRMVFLVIRWLTWLVQTPLPYLCDILIIMYVSSRPSVYQKLAVIITFRYIQNNMYAASC